MTNDHMQLGTLKKGEFGQGEQWVKQHLKMAIVSTKYGYMVKPMRSKLM